MSAAPGSNTVASGPPANPPTMRLFELLEGGEWHVLSTVSREAGKLIPPGRAMRRAEARRKNASKSDERATPVDEDRLLAGGRKSIVRDLINTNRAYLEIKVDDSGTELIRMIGFPPRVARDRARARAHFHFNPVSIADEIAAGAHAKALLAELTHANLLLVALELAQRERARHSSG